MELYLVVMVTALVVTQIIRLIQNTVSLINNKKLLKKQLDSISEITDEDLKTQREAYRLIVCYLRTKLAGFDDGK